MNLIALLYVVLLSLTTSPSLTFLGVALREASFGGERFVPLMLEKLPTLEREESSGPVFVIEKYCMSCSLL